jgi:hypothetical protein
MAKSLAHQTRPVPVSSADIGLPVIIPGFLHLFIEIEIKLVINY